MALLTLPEFCIPAKPIEGTNASIGLIGQLAMTASGHKVAAVLQLVQSGSITSVSFRTRTITGSASVNVRLETVNASGNPSGTLVGANTSGSQGSLASDTFYTVTLTAAASVTAGVLIAVVIEYVSGTSVGIAGMSNAYSLGNFPYGDQFASAWTKGDTIPVFVLTYSDGTNPYHFGVWAFASFNDNAFDVNDTFTGTGIPAEQGSRFVADAAWRVCGIWAFLAAGANADYELRIYRVNTLVATLVVDADTRVGTGYGMEYRRLASTLTLDPGVIYNIVVKPTTANDVTLLSLTLPTTALAKAFPGNGLWFGALRGPINFGQSANSYYTIGLIVNGIELPAPFQSAGMTGGLRG